MDESQQALRTDPEKLAAQHLMLVAKLGRPLDRESRNPDCPRCREDDE